MRSSILLVDLLGRRLTAIRGLAAGLATALLVAAAATAAPGAHQLPPSIGRPIPARSPASLQAPAPAPGEACRRPWLAPVDAPITDPFRPPDHRYGPGNRGIEYGTELGQDVLAVADGVVEFAGPVAGRPVVVIDHGGGLRSSYVHLVERSVGRGLTVERGQRIAAADLAFHLGARLNRRYLDPAELIERRCVVVRLVPA